MTRIWRDEKLAPLIALQRQLLARAVELLAPGGRLVYSTCTTNPRENEEQIAWIRERSGLESVRLFPMKGCSFLDTDQACAPGSLLVDGPASGGQSFFLACLAKPGNLETEKESGGAASSSQNCGVLETDTEPAPDWRGLPPGRVLGESGRAFFLPQKADQVLGRHISWRGLELGKITGGVFLPRPELRRLLPREGRAVGLQVEDTSSLHRLLSGQSLRADSRAKRLGLYWRGLPLGWLTVKGKRLLWSGRSQ